MKRPVWRLAVEYYSPRFGHGLGGLRLRAERHELDAWLEAQARALGLETPQWQPSGPGQELAEVLAPGTYLICRLAKEQEA